MYCKLSLIVVIVIVSTVISEVRADFPEEPFRIISDLIAAGKSTFLDNKDVVEDRKIEKRIAYVDDGWQNHIVDEVTYNFRRQGKGEYPRPGRGG